MLYVNRFLIFFFFLLSLFTKIGGYVAGGLFVWLSFLTLAIWGILAGNVLLLLYQVFRRKGFRYIVFPLLAILLHLDFLLSVYQPFGGNLDDVDGKENLKIITYNSGSFYFKKERTLAVAAQTLNAYHPDIICMQEAPNPTAYTEDSLKLAFADFPYSYLGDWNDHSFLHIYSRYPLENVEQVLYRDTKNASLIADINIHGQMFRLFSNHFQTTSVNANRGKIEAESKSWLFRLKALGHLILQMKENFRKRSFQADYIASEIKASPYPVIVCGDFNDLPSSYTYHKVKGALIDGFKEAGRGYQYTFRGLKKLLRIDYIFHSKELKGIRCYSPDHPYSDHNMVIWEGVIK